MKRCTRCLYPDLKPDLWFDEHGVCSACLAFDKRKEIDWFSRETELAAVLEAGRNRSGYDVIVPSSGGKDSTWQVLKLIELGARPLVVTATTCHLTPIGRANIDNLARYATTIEVSPNKDVRAKLNRLGLELVGDISWPEHLAIFTTPFRMAVQLGIPLIFYGESPQREYGGPPGTEDAKEMTARWVQEFGGLNGLRPMDMVGQEGITERDMADYMPPDAEHVRHAGVRAYFLGQFYEWDSWRNAEVAKAHGMQWRVPTRTGWWPHENLDNAQTGLHDHAMFLKYGYGRMTAQISVDIRSGRQEREEGLAIVRRRDGLFPEEYMGVPVGDVLDRIGRARPWLDAVLERFTNKALLAA